MKSTTRNPWIIALAALAVLAITLACGSAATSTPQPAQPTAAPAATATPPPAPTATAAPVAEPVEPTRCQPADPALLAAIAAGLTVTGGGDLATGWTVRSGDFEQVYFVAAEIAGQGMDGTAGLWATNNIDGAGMIFAVDAIANEFSDWADGRATDAALSTGNDGAQAAIECLDQP